MEKYKLNYVSLPQRDCSLQDHSTANKTGTSRVLSMELNTNGPATSETTPALSWTAYRMSLLLQDLTLMLSIHPLHSQEYKVRKFALVE